MALLSASSHLTSILLWSLLPSLLSSFLLRIVYTLSPSSQPRVPANPSPQQLAHENHRAREHSRWARIVLVAGYLVWTLSSCYWEQGGINSNYYTLLGIERELVEQEGASAVKSRWRRLARVYHPDKVGKEGEAFFVLLRRGVDVLENEGKRWGYERFGPDVVEWGKLVTNREFLVRGVQGSAAFYIFALGSIMAVSFFRKDERAYNFWRYLALALTLFTELHLILRPSPSPLFSLLLPSRLPYQYITFLRQLFISCSMALSQLVPLLFPSSTPTVDPNAFPEEQAAARALADAEALRPLLQRLALLTAQADAETVALQQQEMRPLFVVGVPEGESKSERKEREEKVVRELKKGMRRTFKDLQVKGNPATAEVWAGAVRKGRAEKGARKGKKDKEKEKKAKGSGRPFPSTSTSTSTSTSGASTPSSLLLPTNPLTLRSPSPTPSFTAASTSLASPPSSPPSSPKLSFTVVDPVASTSTSTVDGEVSAIVAPLPETPVKKREARDVPLPPSPANSVDGDGEDVVVVGNGGAKENGSAKAEQEKSIGPDARRLQSPPPE